MAENAVHLTSIEHSKPTIFEIWAEESFMASLQPAFQLLSDFVRSKIPGGKCGPLKIIFQWPDETFLVFNLIMQSTYLDWFNASFSESFYGLKRVNIKSPNEPLSRTAKLLSLMGLVGAPYVMVKFKAIVDKYLYSTDGETTKGLKMLERYRIVSTLLRLVKLYYYISYLSGSNVHHSIFNRLAGVQLVQQHQPSPSWADVCSLIRHEPNRLKLVGPLAFKMISQLFEFGSFTLQFINWWNSSDSEVFKFNKNPIPSSVDPINTNKLCPICKKPWKLEVALSTSGIVYCYSCITRVLADTGHCPVTGLPFTMNDLIRLYPSAT